MRRSSIYRDGTSQSPSRTRNRRVDLLRRPRPPCGPANTAGPQWLDASRGEATADYAPALRSPWRAAEEKIYGEFQGDNGVPLAPKYLCERCADLLFSLTELGYCERPWEDQRELVREYAEMHADFKPGTKT